MTRLESLLSRVIDLPKKNKNKERQLGLNALLSTKKEEVSYALAATGP